MKKTICASLAMLLTISVETTKGMECPGSDRRAGGASFDLVSQGREIFDLSQRLSSLSIRDSLLESEISDPYLKKTKEMDRPDSDRGARGVSFDLNSQEGEISDLSQRFSSLSIRDSLLGSEISDSRLKKLIRLAQPKVQKAIYHAAASQSTFTAFILFSTPLLSDSVPAVCQAIKVLQLKCWACNCSCLSGLRIEEIKDAIKQSTTLRNVVINGNSIGVNSQWISAIIDILNSRDNNIERLAFSGVIDTGHVKKFAKALVHNTSLKRLRLINFANFNPKVQKQIRKAVKLNPNLELEGF